MPLYLLELALFPLTLLLLEFQILRPQLKLEVAELPVIVLLSLEFK